MALSTPGRIFINTGMLSLCESVDEVAGVLAHELGHVIGRHIAETRAAQLFARNIAQFFGWNGELGLDLISSRVSICFSLYCLILREYRSMNKKRIILV